MTFAVSAFTIRCMTKNEAISLFGSPEELRKALGLKPRHAVYMWKENEPIPEVHELKIRHVLKPELFGNAPSKNAA